MVLNVYSEDSIVILSDTLIKNLEENPTTMIENQTIGHLLAALVLLTNKKN